MKFTTGRYLCARAAFAGLLATAAAAAAPPEPPQDPYPSTYHAPAARPVLFVNATILDGAGA